MKKTKVALLSKKRGNYELQERLAESEVVIDTTGDEVRHYQQALLDAGFDVKLIKWGPKFIDEIRNAKVDIAFNVSSLIEATILEEYQIPFVGSSTDGIVLARNKELAKKMWIQNGIPTSEFVVIRNMNDCQNFIKNPTLPYPLFIKPLAGRGSAGISSDSIIENSSNLINRVEKLLNKIEQPVLVEQFLSGREVTIGLIGNGENLHTLPPMEVKYQDNMNFLTFETKEEDSDKFICPADLSAEENELIRKYAKEAFSALGLRDYGRIDTKLTDDGFKLLEANSFAGLTTIPPEKPHSYIGVMARAEGMDGKELLKKIMVSALERIRYQ